MENQTTAAVAATEEKRDNGFAEAEYTTCLDALVKAIETLTDMAARFDEDDFRRRGLNSVSDTIYADCMGQMASIIGRDYVSDYVSKHVRG